MEEAEVKFRAVIRNDYAFWELTLDPMRSMRGKNKCDPDCPELGVANALQEASVMARTEYLRLYYSEHPEHLKKPEPLEPHPK